MGTFTEGDAFGKFVSQYSMDYQLKIISFEDK